MQHCKTVQSLRHKISIVPGYTEQQMDTMYYKFMDTLFNSRWIRCTADGCTAHNMDKLYNRLLHCTADGYTVQRVDKV